MAIFRREPPPQRGRRMQVGWAEIAILNLYLASLRAAVNAVTSQVLSIRHRRITGPQVVTFIAGSKRRSLLMAEDDNELFMTRSLSITPKPTEQRSDNSVAYVTNHKRLLDVLYY